MRPDSDWDNKFQTQLNIPGTATIEKNEECLPQLWLIYTTQDISLYSMGMIVF